MDVTIFGCEPDEATVFRAEAPALGINPVITDAPVSESTIYLAKGNRCISVGHKWQITNAQLQGLSDVGVEYISTRSIGYNHVDIEFARSVGITVENVAYSPDSVADYALMLMLMTLRGAKSVVLGVDRHDYRLSPVRGRDLRELTVGVIGTGRIGSAVITRLAGFGCRILAFDSTETTAAEYVSLDELLHTSDIVTLHVPLDSDTHHLIDDRGIALMKRGAFVINTGRGSLIDTSALLTALESGKLGGAGLDVLEGEDGIFYADHSNRQMDGSAFSRIQALPNVVITPHTAYYTEQALNDTVVNSLINCQSFEKGTQHA
jgi:D-specific alpha-keto acid dehydrogenase